MTDDREEIQFALPVEACGSESVHAPHWWKADFMADKRQCEGVATCEHGDHPRACLKCAQKTMREEFTEARTAGKAIHQAQRLERARQAHYNEAVKAAAVAMGLADNRDTIGWRALAEAAVEAALPHLRAYQIEVQTRIGHALGRKETAEEIAKALEAEALSDHDAADDLRWAAAKAREIGKGDPT